MKPKTPVILSKKWIGRSFHLKVPMRTNSVEVLKAGTVVTTTGELTKSRWFVCVKYPVRYKHGNMHLEDWVRRKDLLDKSLAFPISMPSKNQAESLARRNRKAFWEAFSEIQGFNPFIQTP